MRAQQVDQMLARIDDGRALEELELILPDSVRRCDYFNGSAIAFGKPASRSARRLRQNRNRHADRSERVLARALRIREPFGFLDDADGVDQINERDEKMSNSAAVKIAFLVLTRIFLNMHI
ncbi:hypothetical protein [Paraburkholderia phymatum]|uniref:hypothetical protein n=1 Tax=Paraburkholderia phymatum TaxID=148447 RepID=UPI003D17C0EF